jgi:hypothetical protein
VAQDTRHYRRNTPGRCSRFLQACCATHSASRSIDRRRIGENGSKNEVSAIAVPDSGDVKGTWELDYMPDSWYQTREWRNWAGRQFS